MRAKGKIERGRGSSGVGALPGVSTAEQALVFPVHRGQMLRASVLQAGEGASVLIGMFGSTFRAESLVPLEPGQEYDFEVVETDPVIRLRALLQDADASPAAEKDLLSVLGPPSGSDSAAVVAANGHRESLGLPVLRHLASESVVGLGSTRVFTDSRSIPGEEWVTLITDLGDLDLVRLDVRFREGVALVSADVLDAGTAHELRSTVLPALVDAFKGLGLEVLDAVVRRRDRLPLGALADPGQVGFDRHV